MIRRKAENGKMDGRNWSAKVKVGVNRRKRIG